MFLDLLREVGEEAVQKWESLSRDQQLEIARELIPDIEEVCRLALLTQFMEATYQ